MEIILRKGGQTVSINTGYRESEEDCTWGEMLDELIWPALRAFGYVIDESWTEELQEEHREYIASHKYRR